MEPSTDAVVPGPGAPASAAFRPLNVRDALQYLDRVKQQFAHEYQVYDHFLNIMKDFKTQNIDTPGVIERVSTLFRGHPSLIQGFNTFLPPGYRIECSVSAPNEEGASNTITVTTPMGVTIRTQDVTGVEAREFVRSQPAQPAVTPAVPTPAPAFTSPVPPPSTQAGTPTPPATAPPAAAASVPPPSKTITLPTLTPATILVPSPSTSATPPVPTPLPAALAPKPLPSATTARIATPPVSRLSSPPAAIPPYSGHRRESPALAGRPGLSSANNSGSGNASPLSQSVGGGQQPQAIPRFLPALPSSAAAARTRSDEGEFAAVNSAASAIQGAANSNSGGSGSGSMTPGGTVVAPPPTTATSTPIMEFNHAINYVNKIKNRFTKDPETYKTFLEILQTYQKEARPIQEVYTQVTALFHSAPDLLDEFKAFLPDTTGGEPLPNPSNFGPPPSSTGAKNGRGTPGRDPAGGKGYNSQQGFVNTVLGSGSGAEQKKKSGQVPGMGGPIGGMIGSEEKKKRAAPGMGERAKAKRAKTHHSIPGETPLPPIPGSSGSHPHSKVDHRQGEALPPPGGYHPHGHAHSHSQHQLQQPQHYQQQAHPQAHPQALPLPPHVQHIHQPYGAPPPTFPGAPRMQSAYDTYLTTHRTPALVQAEEFAFFDRVKKYLDDRAAYTEFLKLLNLFTQEIIDVNTLMERSLLFIGGSDELVGAFKDLVAWDSVKDGRIEGEDWIIDNEPVLERPKLELHSMKSFGPSYRKLPDSEIDLACSARDSLEWSVLNDEWVAFATWASEGSGAHRKNAYEDALYNSEQERHWYSFQIESNLRTICHLEPIAARIALMNSEERNTYRLEAGLGGDTPSVYERVIKKIYGKDQGYEILQALCDNPAVAVPIVLARLKQKDEEWKRAEREWNKVWREVDSKNFYRALDHQAIPFKALDKKTATTSKSLITEIETLRRDKQQKRFELDALFPAPLRPLHQFELGMADRDVLFDVLKLSFSFLDRDQSGTSAPERARVEAFLRLFVPLLFGVPHSDMEANLAHSDETPENEDEDALHAGGGGGDAQSHSDVELNGSVEPSTNGTSSHKNGVNKKGGAADLRKRLLTHAAATAGRSPGRPVSRGGSPTPGNGSIASTSASGGEEGASPRAAASAVGIILGEQTWIQLNEIKKPEEQAKLDEQLRVPTRRFNFFANSTFYCLIRIIHTLYHRLSTFKKLCAEQAAKGTRRLSPFGVELGLAVPVPFIDQGENPAEQYYEHALDLAEKLFDGDLDQATYEEHLRYMVGTHAYPLFTIDKLISAIIKHIHTINGDAKCHDLVTLLEKDRARDYTTPRQQIAYRMEAESIVGAEENLYRIEWIPNAGALTVQFLHREDLTLDDAYGDEAKMHASWVASFALTSATEGIGAQVQAPLLKRNRVLSAAEDPVEFDLAPGLEAKVLDDSYQLLFVANSEDYLHRQRPAVDTTALMASMREKRLSKFNAWLQSVSPAVAAVASTSNGTQDADAVMNGSA